MPKKQAEVEEPEVHVKVLKTVLDRFAEVVNHFSRAGYKVVSTGWTYETGMAIFKYTEGEDPDPKLLEDFLLEEKIWYSEEEE